MELNEPEGDWLLTREEARVLGCLLEKERTTPGAYPLTLNNLLLACNQKSNRHPVVDYEEATVAEAIEGLREKHWVYRSDGAGSRVPKYKHRLAERMDLDSAGKALLTVLLLRGPQTPGELRARCERMHPFPDSDTVEKELEAIAEEAEPALWRELPPAPGQKEVRYAHLLCGPEEPDPESAPVAPEAPAVVDARARNERIRQLEERVASLETELGEVRDAFRAFKKEFE